MAPTPVAQPPTDPDADRLARRCAETMLADDRGSASLGIELLDVGPGRAEVAMTLTESMTNGFHIGHGGFLFALADTAFAVACNTYGRVTVAAGCDIDFVAPAAAGDRLTAVAVERHRRGRSGLYDVTVRRADGAVLAEMRGRAREIGGAAAR